MAKNNGMKSGSGTIGYMTPSEAPQPKIKGLDNGVLNRDASTDPKVSPSYGERANLDFPGMLARGSNPHGFRSVTTNGVQSQSDDNDRNSDYRWGESTDGNRWGKNKPWKGDMSGN